MPPLSRTISVYGTDTVPYHKQKLLRSSGSSGSSRPAAAHISRVEQPTDALCNPPDEASIPSTMLHAARTRHLRCAPLARHVR